MGFNMEDKDIIALYFARTERAITETDNKYGPLCRSISYRILYNHEDTEECVSDTYLQVWKSIPPTQPVNLCAFLAKITRNLSLNRKKFNERLSRGGTDFDCAYEELEGLVSGSENVEDAVNADLLSECLTQWLSSLPITQRMVFVGRYWYFDSIEAISRKMGFSQSKTKMLLLRLRRKLHEHLKKEGFII